MWCMYLSVFLIFGVYGTFGRQKGTFRIVSTDSGTTNTAATTQKVNPTSCRCVPVESCPPNTVLDLRIVNQGTAASCPTGQTWCCEEVIPKPSLECGKRRITDAAAQPPGTARYGDNPWQVAIMSTNNTYLGSGVLIDDRHVLTVAHKVVPYPNFHFLMRLGDWDIQATNEKFPHQVYTSIQIFVPKNYIFQNLSNDIAIVRLNASVPLANSLNINTACLPMEPPVNGQRCYVAGWGTNVFGPSGMYQRILKDVDVPIVDQTTCENNLRATRLGANFNLDRNTFMCAGGEAGKDSCTGDGGAPLMCLNEKSGKWTVVGLVAWGIGCASTSTPGVYININNYSSWIKESLSTK